VSAAPIPTGIEAMVCEDIARRQQFGVAKYGTTLMQNQADLAGWLQHAYEEALDLALYLKRAQVRMQEDAVPAGWKPSDGYVERARWVDPVRVPDDPPVLDPSSIVTVDGLVGFLLKRVESGAPLSPCPAASAMGDKACQDRAVCPEVCGALGQRIAIPPSGGLA
jgi:hypothetical protein